MRILVIGGTGFIGRHVVLRLVDGGREVMIFHRGDTVADLPPNTVRTSGDRRDIRSFTSEFKRFAPDAVLDMICYTEQEAQSLISVLESVCQRVVVASSMDVYRNYGRLLRLEAGPPDPHPLTEDSPLRESECPHRAIANSPRDFAATYEKRHVERVLASAPSFRATILRLPAVYGPGDKYHRTFEYLKRMDDGRQTILLEESRARWPWTRGYVENVADAIALAVLDDRAAGRVYNIGEADALTEAQWVRSIGRAAGWNGEVVTLTEELLPPHLAAPYNFAHHLNCDTSKIREELGYAERVSRDEAMKKTVAWQRAHPPNQGDAVLFDYEAEDAVLAELRRANR
jgi:nucleoside-diphosphate-sugar epimerase